MRRAIEEQVAHVWTLRSQARIGSYQHECSSGPGMILASEEIHLRKLLVAAHLTNTSHHNEG